MSKEDDERLWQETFEKLKDKKEEIPPKLLQHLNDLLRSRRKL